MNAFKLWEFTQSYIISNKHLLKLYLTERSHQSNLGRDIFGQVKNKNKTSPKSYTFKIHLMEYFFCLI